MPTRPQNQERNGNESKHASAKWVPPRRSICIPTSSQNANGLSGIFLSDASYWRFHQPSKDVKKQISRTGAETKLPKRETWAHRSLEALSWSLGLHVEAKAPEKALTESMPVPDNAPQTIYLHSCQLPKCKWIVSDGLPQVVTCIFCTLENANWKCCIVFGRCRNITLEPSYLLFLSLPKNKLNMETNCVKRRTGPNTHVMERTAKTHGTYSNKTLRFWMIAMHTSKYLLSYDHLGMIALILSITPEDTAKWNSSLPFKTDSSGQYEEYAGVAGSKIRLNHSPPVSVWN